MPQFGMECSLSRSSSILGLLKLEVLTSVATETAMAKRVRVKIYQDLFFAICKKARV